MPGDVAEVASGVPGRQSILLLPDNGGRASGGSGHQAFEANAGVGICGDLAGSFHHVVVVDISWVAHAGLVQPDRRELSGYKPGAAGGRVQMPGLTLA